MRDFHRLDRILNKVALIWKRQPDQRLGQLMVNLVGEPRLGFDIHSVEDDTLEDALDAELKKLGIKIGGGFRLDE